MMDATPMYPEGFHPALTWKDRDNKKLAKYYTRTERPPRYYLVDFGLSRRYKPENMPKPLEPIILGGDKSPPEHLTEEMADCDPFPTDIYYLGNMLRREFIEVSPFSFFPRFGRINLSFRVVKYLPANTVWIFWYL